MYIRELELAGYKRFFLSNIKKIIYTPSKRINIIIGRGGCGKSSLLRELSPLPANLTKDYSDDGYKKITIDHRGSEYILVSGCGGKNKHSFIVNGAELNVGGTRRMQLHLVKDHFGITPDIHEVLLGENNFSTMSPSSRKDWVMSSADIDYDYVIKVYTRLKQRHRDAVGALKIAQNELSSSVDSIMSEEEIKGSKGAIEYFNSIIDSLFEKKATNVENIDCPTNDIINTTAALKSLIDKTKIDDTIDIANIDNEIVAIKANIHANEALQNDMRKEYLRLKDVEASLHVHDSSTIIDEIKTIDNNIDAIKASMYVDLNPSDIETISDLTASAITNLSPLLDEIEELSDFNIGVDEYRNAVVKRDKLADAVALKKARHSRHIDDLRVMESKRDNNKTTCPACNHIWSVGFTESEYIGLKKTIDSVFDDITANEKEYENVAYIVDTYVAKDAVVKKINSIIASYPKLSPVWDYIFARHNIATGAAHVRRMLEAFFRDTSSWVDVCPLLDKKQKLENDLTIAVARTDMELEHVTTALDKTSDAMHELVIKEKNDKDRIVLLQNTSKRIKEIDDITLSLRALIRKKHRETKNDILKKQNDVINNLIRHFRLEITRLENANHESEKKRAVVNERKRVVDDLRVRVDALDALLNTLSPNNGIIAKSIVMFMTNFVRDINTVINTVWNYRMDVLPCKVGEEDDLDYKFPVVVDSRETIDDIDKTSSSMREIINLAFRIVSMKYIGMSSHPLHLDEYGRTMDDAHRAKAFDTIDTLAGSSFNQIFIVSHFASSYTKFSDASITILDPENLLFNSGASFNRDIIIS